MRFCRSVGYDGLAEFKRKLAGTVNEGVPFIHRSVDADEKTSDVIVKVIDNTVSAFLKYRNEASSVAIEKAVTALTNTYQAKRQIQFFGVGNSGIVAQDAQHKFFRLGINTTAYSDGHIHLSADHPEGFDRYSPKVSRLLHLMIIDILVTCVARRIGGDTLQPLLSEMKHNLRNKRYA